MIMTGTVALLLIVSVASFGVLLYITRSFSNAGIKTFLVVGALCLVPLIYFSLGEIFSPPESEPYSIVNDKSPRQSAPKSESKPASTSTAPVAPRITHEQFEQNFIAIMNDVAASIGSESISVLGEPERRSENGQDKLIYPLMKNLSLAETVSGNVVRRVNVVLTEATQDSIFAALVVYDAAIRAFAPGVDVNAVHRELGLDENIVANLTKNSFATIGGIRYEKKFLGNGAFVFSAND